MQDETSHEGQEGGEGRAVVKKLAGFAESGMKPGEIPGQGRAVLPIGVEAGGGGEGQAPTAARGQRQEGTDVDALFGTGDLVSPPLDFGSLLHWYENSDTLPVAVEIVAVNVAGHGAEFVPRWKQEIDGKKVAPPDGAEQERNDLAMWWASINLEQGAVGLLMRQEKEIGWSGCSYLEVLRTPEGKPAALEPLEAASMRLGRLSSPVLVKVAVRHPETNEIAEIYRWRRFRRFVQLTDRGVVWFKEYGDPRSLNRATGIFSKPGTDLGTDDNGNDLNASEVYYTRTWHPGTPYGVPLWVSSSPHVKAGRKAAEVLLRWLEKAPIGAKILALVGGTFKAKGANSLKALVEALNRHARGTDQAFQIFGLEAEASAGADLMDTAAKTQKIEQVDVATPLPAEIYHGETSVIEQSALRQRRPFRLPAIYFGDSTDYNRATADTAAEITEGQVFAILRRDHWERWINERLLPELGIRFWSVRMRGFDVKGEDGQSKIESVVKGGGASPNQLIRFWNEQTGLETPPIEEPWADRPLDLVMALLAKGLNPNLSVAEIVAEMEKQRAEGLAAAQAMQDAAGDKPPPPPGNGPGAGEKGGKGDPVAQKAEAVVGALLTLQRAAQVGVMSPADLERARRGAE